MSLLATAIADEISTRRARRVELAEHLTQIDAELDQLGEMSKLFESLNGNGAQAPAPAEPSRGCAASGGRSLSGRNGGKAPAPSRQPAGRGGRNAGSAPSGTRSPRRAPSSTASERAAVLAFIQANGKVKIADVASGVGISVSGAKKNIQALVAAGDIQAEGLTRSRVYFAPATRDEAPPSPEPEAPIDWAYVARRVLATIAHGPLSVAALAEKIDAPADVVQQQCDRLVSEGKASRMSDGTYVA